VFRDCTIVCVVFRDCTIVCVVFRDCTIVCVVFTFPKFRNRKKVLCRSQWPRGLRRRSAASRLLGLWVRVPPLAWMSVCFECCVLSG